MSVCSPVDGAPSSGILFRVVRSASLIPFPILKVSFHQRGTQDGIPEKNVFSAGKMSWTEVPVLFSGTIYCIK